MNRFIIIVLIFAFKTTYSQKLNIYSFNQVDNLQLIENRPVFVFVSTSWCKYCQKMHQTVFKNKEVIQLLNQKYYFVIVEADSKETIVFKNKKFEYKPNGVNVGYNQIVEFLFPDNQIIFPTILVFNSNWEQLLLLQSSLNKTDFLNIFR